MTRVNLVPPECLTDKHLLAEYHEIPRIITKVNEIYESGKDLSSYSIPQNYVLGKGHVTFFYNKIVWINDRVCDLFEELLDRGVNVNELTLESILVDGEKIRRYDDQLLHWEPHPDEIYLNMARLVRRSKSELVQNELKSTK